MQKKKPPAKSKVSKKKVSISKKDSVGKDLPTADWGNGLSLVEVRGEKCVISFPTQFFAQGCFDGDLGLIAVLAFNGIRYEDRNYKNPCEVIFVYPKKDLRKIKSIENAYFNHTIQVDAKEISDYIIISLVNYIVPTGPKYNFSGKEMEYKKEYFN